jgi:hypothetical protein
MAFDLYDEKAALEEFTKHGELWIQQKLSGKLKTIFDVGSNIGEWTRMTRRFQPQAEIHMFEIIPDTYRKSLKNIEIDDKIIPNGFGLSNEAGTLPMKYRMDADYVSTYISDMRVDNFEWREGLIMKGDDYVNSRKIDYIDYLKIDTEGAEKLVLEGFKDTLKQKKIGMIQFEYGFICILSKWLLIDAYRLFTPLGYKLGRLTDQGIQFHDYKLTDETFNGPDYIAVHESKIKDVI